MEDGVEPKAKGKGKAAGSVPNKKAAGDAPKNPEVLIARMLVRALWQQDWVAANPDGKAPERKTAWKEARQARMEQQLKSARKALATLQRLGVTMTLSPKAATGDDDDGADA